MKRKSIVAVFVLLLAIMGLCYLWYIAPEKKNTLSVFVQENLFLDKVVIQNGFYSINSDSDETLLTDGLETTVFSGVVQQPLETICGENDFLIIYEHQYYTIFRHFIPNDFYDAIPKPHHYNFHVEKLDERLFVTLDIQGTNETKYRRELVTVRNAKNQVWGKLKH